MLKMMDLDDVTVEQCSTVTSSRWSFIFQVKVWPQVISSSSVVDNALKTRAANLRFFVFMALSTSEVTCVTLRLSKKWDPALLRPLLFFIVFGALSTTEVSRVTHFSDIVSCLQAASLRAGTCVSSVRCIRSRHPLRQLSFTECLVCLFWSQESTASRSGWVGVMFRFKDV